MFSLSILNLKTVDWLLARELSNGKGMLFSVEQAFVGPLKTLAREAIHITNACEATLFGRGLSLVNHYREYPPALLPALRH